MELIRKVSEDLYIIRLRNAACVVDGSTYKKLQKIWREDNAISNKRGIF